MYDFEDLVKQLRFCACAATCEGCPYGFGGCEEDLMKDAAKAIEELSSAGSIYGKAWTLGYDAGRDENSPRWISVTERLPENPDGLRREYFLVALESGCVESLGYDFDCNRWHISGSSVTHWMPLPIAPAEE